MHEKDEDAGIFAEAQDGYHAVEREHDLRLKVRGSGRLKRLVIANMHENVCREAAEAEIHVARFSRRILRRKSVREYVYLVILLLGHATWSRKKGTDPLLYQILYLENRRSREHRTEHVATNFCVCIFNKAGRRLVHIECAIYGHVLVPLVPRVVDLIVHVRVRKVELLPQIQSPSNAQSKQITYQVGL